MIPGVPYDAEIEYLQSSGTQWIDTGFSFSTASRIVFSVNTLQAGTSSQWCVLGANSSSNEVLLWYRGATTYLNGKTISIPLQYNKRYYVDLVVLNGSASITVDGVLQGTSTGKNNGKHIYLFGSIAGGRGTVIDSYNYQKIYEFKLYDQNGTLVRDLIPVRVGQTGYMYDRVTKRLFGNKGTGSFVLGPDVARPVMGLWDMHQVTFPMDYVQDGLTAHFDAICNGPNGEHNTNTYKWYDLTGNEQPLVTWGNIIPIWKDNYTYNFRAYFRNTAISRDYTARGYTEEFVTCNGWANPLNDAVIGVSLTTNNWLQTSNNAYRFGVFGKYPVILYSSDVVNSKSRKCITFSIRPDGIGTLYIDGGSIVAPMSNKAHPYTTLSGSHAIGVGKNDNSVYNKGIHAYRVYNRALSADEIAHNYAIDKARFNLP